MVREKNNCCARPVLAAQAVLLLAVLLHSQLVGATTKLSDYYGVYKLVEGSGDCGAEVELHQCNEGPAESGSECFGYTERDAEGRLLTNGFFRDFGSNQLATKDCPVVGPSIEGCSILDFVDSKIRGGRLEAMSISTEFHFTVIQYQTLKHLSVFQDSDTNSQNLGLLEQKRGWSGLKARACLYSR
jgi:hypothetical protein